jgi:hypothetical protein
LVRPNSLCAVARASIAALATVLLGARPASAQDNILHRLNVDNLEVQSLGISYGRILPSQIVPATILGLQGDYGNVAPNWRIVFGASYWSSRLDDDIVQAFADTLQKSLSDPTAHVVASPIRIFDVTFSGDVRYMPSTSAAIKPFGGVGIAAHVVNAEGTLIKGTFVERSLDDIAAGLYATGGIWIALLSHFGVEASARGDLLSGFRSTQVKVGAAYILGPRRATSDTGAARSSSAARERSIKR